MSPSELGPNYEGQYQVCILEPSNNRGAELMDLCQDIDSLAHFQENTTEIIERLKTSGQPLTLTVDGETEIVVQAAKPYRRMLDLLDRAEAFEGIRRGLASMERGEGRPAEEVFEDIRRRHGIPRDA